MKVAQLTSPGSFDFIDVAEPRPQAGETLVRMEHLAICGTDMHVYRNEVADPYPLAPGKPCHEGVGVVEESRDPRFTEGQRVIVVKDRLLAEKVCAPGDALVRVPHDADPALWVLCQPVGTVLYAVRRLENVAGSRIAVVGQGPIGLGFTALLSRAGARQIIGIDLHESRLRASRAMGATDTIDASDGTVVEQVRDLTDGAMVDIAVEAVGSPDTYHSVFEVTRRLAQVILFGSPPHTGPFTFDWRMVYDRLPTIHVTSSSRAGARVQSVRDCVDLVARGELDLSGLVSHRFHWSDLSEVYALYADRKADCLKTIVSTEHLAG